MKSKDLGSGNVVLVDDEDFHFLEKYNWCVNSSNYVMRVKTKSGKRETITLHRLITGVPSNLQVDHANGNRLDNRRKNLRVCTRSQNCVNRTSKVKSKSGYRGVTKHYNKWRARIEQNGKKIHLGLFETPELAAKAYDQIALSLYGDFAVLNFPE
ncbi:MAG: zinc binding loop region of homing endonuclease [Podoviridae sp. ctg2L5]|nr:MAG: zinc binding loop region of homing endonuclease [Podoviridae sp. ctg2L5]